MNDSLHLLWIPALTALVIFVISVSLLTFADMFATPSEDVDIWGEDSFPASDPPQNW